MSKSEPFSTSIRVVPTIYIRTMTRLDLKHKLSRIGIRTKIEAFTHLHQLITLILGAGVGGLPLVRQFPSDNSSR